MSAVLAAHTARAQSIRLGPYLQDAEPTSIWVGWETNGPGESTVEFGLSPRSLAAGPAAQTIVSSGDGRIHHAHLTGLTPGTHYYYRVVIGNDVSGTFRFRTPRDPASDFGFRFAALSDTQGGSNAAKHTEVINEGIIDFVREQFGPNLDEELDFVIEPGDLVDAGSNYQQWKDQYFDETHNLYRQVPIYPVPGNHEQDSHWFFDYFRLPENGTPGFEEHWWYKDHGNIRLIGLDSNTAYRTAQQLEWLDDVLAEAAADEGIDFVFAQLHHPYLSGIWTPGNTDYTGEVVRRLEAFSTSTGKPSIHFFGHTHAYERGQSRDHTHLWVNVAAGEGNIDYWDASDVAYEQFQRVFPDWGFVLMEVQAGADPKFRLRRMSRGNDVEAKDNEVMDDLTVRRYNAAPDAPIPVSPTLGDGDVSPDLLTLDASGFSDPDGGTHLESHFQVTTVSGDYANPATERWIRTENWFAPPGADGQASGYFSVNTVTDPDITRANVELLSPNTTHYWRVRYRDDGLGWSDWSPEAAFTTGGTITGACCLVDGGCVENRLSECDLLGGEWHGPGTACLPAPCPPVLVIYQENFDTILLGPNADEPLVQAQAWSPIPPAGWSVDRTGVPAGGVTEWRGWSFADPEWWSSAAGDQGRSGFLKSSGVLAVADPDEWDDAAHAAGTYNTFLTTPAIALAGIEPGSARLVVDSAWQPEGNQTATVDVRYDGGPWLNVLTWTTGGETAHPADTNETLLIDLANPAGIGVAEIRFGLTQAGNNWFWALDNLRVTGTPAGARKEVFREDFDGLPLGAPLDEPSLGDPTAWTGAPPAGWTLDDSRVPGIGIPGVGVREWEGWSFPDPIWWSSVAGNQRRSEFTRASGAIAVADPDEWDDIGDPESLGPYNATLSTPTISFTGIAPGSVLLEFDSSWRPEDAQRARLVAQTQTGAEDSLLEWTSTPGPLFKPDATNERIALPLSADLTRSGLMLRFEILDAGNDWWWAIDNLTITGRCLADVNLDGIVSPADFSAWIVAFNTGTIAADQNADGSVSPGDFSAWIQNFNAGC